MDVRRAPLAVAIAAIIRAPPAACQTVSASTVAATSCTRTMRAPALHREQRRGDAGGSSALAADRRRGRSDAAAASVDLRDQPASSGTPSASSSRWRRSSSRLCVDASCRSRCPGRATMRSRATPARLDRVDPLAQEGADLGDHVVVVRLGCCIDARRRRACASGRRRSAGCAATASSAPGARSARMSLTMSAPRSSAARITSGLAGVDRDRAAERGPPRAAPAAPAPARRRASTGAAPGRLDSPPMSSMSAPSASSRSQCASAAPASRGGRRRRTNRA